MWRRVGLWKLGVALYIGALCALLGAYMSVSLREVHDAVRITGGELIVGQPNMLRGELTQVRTGRRYQSAPGLEIGLSDLPDGDAVRDVVRPQLGEGGLLHVALTPSRSGPQWLRLRVTLPDREAPLRASAQVNVADARPADVPWPLSSRIPSDEREAARDEPGASRHQGPVKIVTLPQRPELPRGLAGRIYLATYDAITGTPRACDLSFTQRAGPPAKPPATTRTDAYGLLRWDMTASFGARWVVNARCGEGEEQESEASLYLETVASQVALNADTLVIDASAPLAMPVVSLFKQSPLFIDALQAQRRVFSGVTGLRDGSGGVKIDPQALPVRGLAQVQIYPEPHRPEHAWDMQHIFVAEGSRAQALETAWHTMLDMHALHQPSDRQRYWLALRSAPPEPFSQASLSARERWADAALRALEPQFSPPQALLNSLPHDESILEAEQLEARSALSRFIGLALLLGMGWLSIVIFQGLRQRRAHGAALRDEALEWDDELAARGDAPSPDETPLPRDNELMIWVQAGTLLATMMFFAGSLFWLLRYL